MPLPKQIQKRVMAVSAKDAAAEVDASAAKLDGEAVDELEATLTCPKCKHVAPKADFEMQADADEGPTIG